MPGLKLALLYSGLYLRKLEKVIFQNLLTTGFLWGSTIEGTQKQTTGREQGDESFLVPGSGSESGR